MRTFIYVVLIIVIGSCNHSNNSNGESLNKDSTKSKNSTEVQNSGTPKSKDKGISSDSLIRNDSIIKPEVWTFDKLSNNFNYKLTILKADGNEEFSQDVKVIIQISNKEDSLIQKIFVKPEVLFHTSFTNYNDVRSFVTNINKNKQVTDNDFGDFIIGDFNFDLLDDFAIKYGEGGNGGPVYEYYIQDNKTTFKKDRFLTSSMSYFPTKIDKENKTLINYVHANANGVNENIYKLDTLNGKWELIKCTYKGVKAK